MNAAGRDLAAVARDLAAAVAGLRFTAPVAHVYNPLDYAAAPHRDYLRRWGGAPKEVVLLGMNPGPFGMAQTGVPFGEVAAARGWLRVRGVVRRPPAEHPARPVLGFDCPRGEISGRRLWGWAKRRFGTPEAFFARFFVANYCPLLFLAASGRNVTPDRLAAAERAPLEALCDRALVRTVEILRPRWVVGVGRFAAERARAALAGRAVAVGGILHPSPASPAANRDWEATVERQLASLGVGCASDPV